MTISRFAALALGGLAAASLGACTPRTEDTRAGRAASPAPNAAPAASEDTPMVRVVHAIPGGSPADVYADERKTFSSLAYRSVTDYTPVAENEVTFKLRPAGAAGEPLAENREMLSDGSRYTVVALPGERGTPAELKVLRDEKAHSFDAKARVRVVNAAPDSGSLEVILDGRQDALAKGLDPADDQAYRDVDPISGGKLIVRDKKRAKVVAEAATNLAAGRAYTMLVVGRTAGTPEAEVLVVEDGQGR